MNNPNLLSNYAYKGTYYSIKVPRKTVDNKDTGYYDQNFVKIASDPALFEFYTFFRDFMKENLDFFPDEEVDSLQSNFLPVITERLAKEYGLTNLKESVKGIGDWIMNTFASAGYDYKQKLDPVTGKPIYNFEAKFIDEEVPIEERSRDMVVMMKMFGDMGLVYKHKLQIQDYVDAINDIVQNTNKTLEVNEFGEISTPTQAPANLQKMVQSEISRSFYGVKTEKEIRSTSRYYNARELLTLGLYRSDKYKQSLEIEKEITKLQKELEDPNLTEKQTAEITKKLIAKKREHTNLGGRQWSLQKTLDSNIKYSRLLGLALQPFSALRNLLVGGANNLIHAVGGRDFDVTQLKTATFMVRDSIAKFWSRGTIVSDDASKLLKFMLDSGIIEGEDGIYKSGVITKQTTADKIIDRKSTRLNSSHVSESRMPSSA